MKKIRGSLLIIIIAILVSGCSQEIDLTLDHDQRWEFETQLSLNLGMMPELEFDIFAGFGLGFDTAEVMKATLDIGFDQLASYFQIQGLQASWKNPPRWFTDEETYRFSVQGQGWQNLSKLTKVDPSVFGQAQGMVANIPHSLISVTDTGGGQVRFFFALPEDPLGLRSLSRVTYRLHGRKIISCNGCTIRGGTAVWVSPYGPLEAELIPGSRVSSQIATIGLITLGAGGLALAGVWVFKVLANRRQPTYGQHRLPRGRQRTGRSSRRYTRRRSGRFSRRR
jgi:hypothetical protein